MAVLKDIEIAIRSNGTDLPEYPCQERENREDNVSESYVEVVSGAPFQIRMEAGSEIGEASDVSGMSYHLWIDGFRVSKLRRSKLPHQFFTSGVSYVEDGYRYERKLLFAEAATVQGARSNVSMEHTTKVGTIEVRSFRITGTHGIPAAGNRTLRGIGIFERRGPVASKHLIKGCNTLTTSLGPPERVAKPTSTASTYFDDRDHPFVVFKFHYRTRESLELMGIIDESRPEAEPSAMEERPVEDLTREELEEEARKLRASRNESQSRAVKREPTTDETGSQTRKRARNDYEGIEVVSERNIKKERMAPNNGPGASFEEPLELD